MNRQNIVIGNIIVILAFALTRRTEILFVFYSTLMVYFTKQIYWLVALQIITLFCFRRLRLPAVPARTITLNSLFVLSVLIRSEEQRLYLSDSFKVNNFLLFWALLVAYIKNKLVLVYELIKNRKGLVKSE